MIFSMKGVFMKIHDLNNIIMTDSYTLRSLCACCSQSELTILKICESNEYALFLYTCTLHNIEYHAQCLQARQHRIGLIHCYTGINILLATFNDELNCKMFYLSHLKKDKKFLYVMYE